MARFHIPLIAAALAGMLLAPVAAWAENEGLDELDKATQLKVSAEDLGDVNEVVDLLDTALEEGLDAENADFAEQLLVATLIQRAQALSQAILNRPLPSPRQDPRWIRVRQFALTDLQRAVSLDDSQWDAHLLIGQLQTLPLGDPNAARRAFSKVVAAEEVPDADRAKAHALRGAVQQDSEKRLDDFNRAVELDPDAPEYLRLRAQHYYSTEEWEPALADLDAALELDPDHAASHELRGMVLLGQEKYDQALSSFDRASELAPKALLPYQHRGELFRRQGDLQQALDQLDKALQLAPGDTATLLIRAGVHYEAGDVDSAIADIDELLKQQPNSLKVHQMKAEILAGSDRMSEAIKHLEHLHSLAPDQADLQLQLANYYLINSQADQAVEMYSKVIEQDPTNMRALRGRGDSHLNMGRHAEAIADFEKALEIDGDDTGLLNNLAWVLATSTVDEIRDADRALELAKKACELTNYQTPHILSTLAAAYAEKGDFEKAIEWSEKAVELGGDDPQEAQLAEELASYKKGEPWRELKQLPDAEAEPADSEEENANPASNDQTFAPPPATPAPARTTDF